jgi:hypothetical protein
VGPAQALDAWGAFVGLVEGDGALEGADADAEIVGEVGEDGVVVAGAGGELFLGDALTDRPVAFSEGLSGGAPSQRTQRFAKFFGMSAKFWLGLQEDFDLEEESRAKAKELRAIVPLDQTG